MQLLAFYEDEPIKTKNVSVVQQPFDRAEEYTFGNEPTIAKVVYVKHPRIPKRLVPCGQYDRLAMTDKFNEALRIVQTLGAFRVITRSFRGDVSKASLWGMLPASVTTLGPSVELGKSEGDEITFEQLGTGGDPVDPGESAYPDEAGFEAARRAVMLNGARHVTISIESQSAFRVDSDIAVRLERVGFSLGANAERAQVRMLKLEAYFPEKGKRYEPDAEIQRRLTEAKPPLDPDADEKVQN